MHTEYSGNAAARPAITRRRAFGIVARGAALGALSAGSVVAISPPPAEAVGVDDALSKLVTDYEAMLAAWNATSFHTDEAGDEAFEIAVRPLRDRLLMNPPVAATEAGAVAALRFIRGGMQQFGGENYEPLVGAALGYFEARA